MLCDPYRHRIFLYGSETSPLHPLCLRLVPTKHPSQLNIAVIRYQKLPYCCLWSTKKQWHFGIRRARRDVTGWLAATTGLVTTS
jgi:hypothetical protein